MKEIKQALIAIQTCRALLVGKLEREKRLGLIVTEALILKDLPLKPKELDTDCGYFVCPVCDFTVGYTDEYKTHKYCLNCGQKLNWSDGDGNK